LIKKQAAAAFANNEISESEFNEIITTLLLKEKKERINPRTAKRLSRQAAIICLLVAFGDHFRKKRKIMDLNYHIADCAKVADSEISKTRKKLNNLLKKYEVFYAVFEDGIIVIFIRKQDFYQNNIVKKRAINHCKVFSLKREQGVKDFCFGSETSEKEAVTLFTNI